METLETSGPKTLVEQVFGDEVRETEVVVGLNGGKQVDDQIEVEQGFVLSNNGGKPVLDLNETGEDGGESIEMNKSGFLVSGENVPLVVVINGGLNVVVDGGGRTVNGVVEIGEPENPNPIPKPGFGGERTEDRDWVFENGGNYETPLEEKSKTGEQEVGEYGKQVEEEQEEQEVGEDRFSVGDFVWVKVKSHPWWPGQICDPLDASAEALKYQKKGRLLVACYGDGTFAWCDSSHLKPFGENFEHLVKHSNLKMFVKAVDEAVEEIGRCIELEMACSCVPKQITDRLERPLAVNAGMKEGVAVPEGTFAGLSITEFDPVEFLQHLKDVAQDVSEKNLLELVVFKSRLSAFYCAKGYSQLPMYHEPLDAISHETNAGNGTVGNGSFEGLTLDVSGIPYEEDWLSSPVGPWLRKTGSISSQKWPEISDEKLYHRKKQRSIAELLAGDMDEMPGENGGPFMAKEGIGSGKPTSTSTPRKKTGSGVGAGSSVAEEVNLSGKRTTSLRKINKNMGLEFGNDSSVSKESGGKTSALRKRNKNMESEFGNNNVVAESGGKTSALRKRNKNMESEFGNNNVVADERTVSGKKPASLKKRNNNMNSEAEDDGGVAEVGNVSNVAEELTFSNNRTRASSKRNTTEQHAEIGNGSDVSEDLTLSGKRTSASRKRDRTKVFEFGDDTDAAEELTASGNRTRTLRKRSKTNYSESGNDSDAAEELIFFGDGGKKNDYGEVEKESGISGEASDGSKRGVGSRKDKNMKLSGNSSSTEKDGLSTNDGSKLGIPLRERKKSKYLSPPYTNLAPPRSLFSLQNSEIDSPDVPKVSYAQLSEDGGVARFTAFPLLEKCSAEGMNRKLPKLSSASPKENQGMNFIEDDSSVNEMLTDFRYAAMDPLRLIKRQSYEAIMGFFMRLRSSFYEEGSNFGIYNKYLAGRDGGKRVSFEAKLSSVGKDAHEADHQTSQGKYEQKKRKRNEGEILNSKKKSKQALGTSGLKMNYSGEVSGETSVAALLLTFAPGVSLPSKDELIKKFEKLGVVVESKTDVLEGSNCAQVVFAKNSDAEDVYNSSVKTNPFGSAVVSYRLRFLPATPRKVNNTLSGVHVGDASSLLSVRESLEVTTAVLEKSWNKLSFEVKANLEAEIKGLLNKVTSAVGA